MPETPLTFAQWRELSAQSPQEAARAWSRRVSLIEATTRRAVLAYTPPEEELEAIWASSVEQGGVLAGIPYLAKDLFDRAGWPTTASSIFLESERGTPTEDSAIVADLNAAGAVLTGKTHLNEFAYGLSGENEHFGDCPHPDCARLLSGGSSSGSAWAVGAGLTPFALGTDTGGSIRTPSSFCGLYGLRLTPDDTWSHEGCFPLARSFDTAGFLTRTAEDLGTLVGLTPEVTAEGGRAPRGGLWLGDLTGTMDAPLVEALEAAVRRLDCRFDEEISRQFASEVAGSRKAFNILQSTEALKLHEPWLEKHQASYDSGVYAKIVRARNWTESDLESSSAVQDDVIQAFADLFASYEFVVLPATPCPAVAKRDLSAEFRERLLTLTTPASVARLPALTLPVFLDPLRSVGLQVIFPRSRLHRVAKKLLG